MIVALGLASAFASGVDPRRLALLAGAIHLPVVVGVVIAVHWFKSRHEDSNEPALFCEGVASELRAGAALRDALATAATSVRSPSISVGDSPGSSISEVAAQVAEAFPSIEEELRLTVMAAARSGSDAAALFDEIGSLAIAQSEIRREIRVAAAPARATALVLLGAPLVYLISQMGSAGLAAHLASSEQRVAALLGLGLFVLGLALACLTMWRATR